MPLYVGLFVHAKTCSHDLVETLYEQGLSLSYDRLINTTSALANSVIAWYESEGVVCPANLCSDLLTTGITDNVDHNSSSTTAQYSLHGTSILLVQHASPANTGNDVHLLNFRKTSKTLKQ